MFLLTDDVGKQEDRIKRQRHQGELSNHIRCITKNSSRSSVELGVDLWVVDELGLQGPERHNTDGRHSPSLDGVNYGGLKNSSTSESLLAGSDDVRTFWVGLGELLSNGRHTNVNKKYCGPIVRMHIKESNEGILALCMETHCMGAKTHNDTE